MIIDICKLCDKSEELQRSHVIGRSVFRNLLKKSESNFAYTTLIKEKKIIKTNDQWVVPLLCKKCESYLNAKYENYSLWSLKNKQHGVKHIQRDGYLTITGVNQYRLTMYLVSIFWRAAHSTHRAYQTVEITADIDEYLKAVILGTTTLDQKLISVKISKLTDRSNGFSGETLTGIITNLVPRTKYKDGFSYFMVFEGYYFEIFFNCLEFDKRNQNGILRKNKRILRVPYMDIFSINELVQNMIQTKAIHDNKEI